MKTIFKIFLLFFSVSVFAQNYVADKITARDTCKAANFKKGSDTLLTATEVRNVISDTADHLRSEITDTLNARGIVTFNNNILQYYLGTFRPYPTNANKGTFYRSSQYPSSGDSTLYYNGNLFAYRLAAVSKTNNVFEFYGGYNQTLKGYIDTSGNISTNGNLITPVLKTASSQTPAYWYTGTANPTATNRLNFDGNLYAESFKGIGSTSTSGIYGQHTTGYGVYGYASSGIAVLGYSAGSGSGVTAQSTTGTGLMVNNITGNTSNIISGQVNSVEKFIVNKDGKIGVCTTAVDSCVTIAGGLRTTGGIKIGDDSYAMSLESNLGKYNITLNSSTKEIYAQELAHAFLGFENQSYTVACASSGSWYQVTGTPAFFEFIENDYVDSIGKDTIQLKASAHWEFHYHLVVEGTNGTTFNARLYNATKSRAIKIQSSTTTMGAGNRVSIGNTAYCDFCDNNDKIIMQVNCASNAQDLDIYDGSILVKATHGTQ